MTRDASPPVPASDAGIANNVGPVADCGAELPRDDPPVATADAETPSNGPPIAASGDATPSDSQPVLGIDFGTSNIAAQLRMQGSPIALVFGHAKHTIPSTISIGDEDGKWYFGKHSITDEHEGYTLIHSVKRVIGRDTSDGRLRQDIEKLKHFELEEGEEGKEGRPVCKVKGKTYTPELLVGMMLSNVREWAQKKAPTPLRHFALTVPAYFTECQRQATRDAARIARMEHVTLLSEPVAAAVAALEGEEKGDYLVVDPGGGTFDCARLHLEKSGHTRVFLLKATSGDNMLGGLDFAQVLADEFRKQVDGQSATDEELLSSCEAAKCNMEPGDEFIRIKVRGISYRVSLEAYRRKCSRLFDRLRDIVKLAAPSEGFAKTKVIFAGGSSQFLWLQPEVRKTLGADIEELPVITPAELMARGAAMSGWNPKILITDVIGRPIGIETHLKKGDKIRKTDVMEVIVSSNEALPAYGKAECVGIYDGTEITIYEGDDRKASNNIVLGKFDIPDVTPGTHFTVKISVGTDLTVEVTANVTDSMKSETLKVERKPGLPEDEIGRSQEEVKNLHVPTNAPDMPAPKRRGGQKRGLGGRGRGGNKRRRGR